MATLFVEIIKWNNFDVSTKTSELKITRLRPRPNKNDVTKKPWSRIFFRIQIFSHLLAQTRIRETRKAVMAEPVRQLKTDNADAGEEYAFWSELRSICLLPEQAAFNQSGK